LHRQMSDTRDWCGDAAEAADLKTHKTGTAHGTEMRAREPQQLLRGSLVQVLPKLFVLNSSPPVTCLIHNGNIRIFSCGGWSRSCEVEIKVRSRYHILGLVCLNSQLERDTGCSIARRGREGVRQEGAASGQSLIPLVAGELREKPFRRTGRGPYSIA
jgi:hypothetical protein